MRLTEAVESAERVFGWQHLAKYSGQTPEWMDRTLTAIVVASRESAEAERDALRERVESVASRMLHEADHLDQIGDHDEAGSVRHYGRALRAALDGL